MDGVTDTGVTYLHACGGFRDITVEQFYYIKGNHLFRHRDLQCIITRQGEFGGHHYTPIELVKVDTSTSH
ncbi:hypothetical protein AAVH_41581 [Aphelenchoides avenae]|nr:hypothetical protein AAVH_41581 [Aphelenchus avenae]